MSDLTHDQITLAVIAIAFMALVGAFAWLMNRKGNALIRNIKDKGPEGLWDELGAPNTIQDAVRDPEQRWVCFIRSRKYRTRCHPNLAAEIDGFLTAAKWGRLVLAIASLGIVYLFWPLMGSKFP